MSSRSWLMTMFKLQILSSIAFLEAPEGLNNPGLTLLVQRVKTFHSTCSNAFELHDIYLFYFFVIYFQTLEVYSTHMVGRIKENLTNCKTEASYFSAL